MVVRKWKPGSRDYEATPPSYQAAVSPRMAERLRRLARDAFRLLGCRDYARVDFRVRPPAYPYILEVNPNPDFSPCAGLSGALQAAGILDWLGIPFTGCPHPALCLARNKHLTKYLLRGAGLPTADSFVVEELPVPECELVWPVSATAASSGEEFGASEH